MNQKSIFVLLCIVHCTSISHSKPLANPQNSRISPEERAEHWQQLHSADLETKIHYLLDRKEIEDLVAAYAYSVDLQDWNLHRSLFTETFEDGTSGTFRKQSVGKRIELLSAYFPQFDGTQHLNVPLSIRIDGDEAFAIATLSTRHFHSDGTPEKNTLLTGQYEFDCTRSEAGWKINRINLVNRRKLTTTTLGP